ncbi:hydroxysteroid dehydrogenase-like protein 2 [Biomphalaria glabrata]|uniref:Hydroxysteroid dehydrogenase-like protein 2 n=1 Tax=Biomphalaria glabrata TaxID=6526 RepID=A0A9W3AGG5_BIOGL|nr:hydroxysteroid dehydrogenase-like protein 2 [Biomphalaria glabrata]
MAANTGKLAGKTIFITGASRGIGKAIALKVAKDGANVVIAAKTADPHPKLPGTIYTASEEVQKAGGNALPCIVDIRNEDQVKEAVQQAVSKFGGIDILINNASAISLTSTLATSMKKYDLMNGINARGTYLCSQACLPYLLKSKNPHILNLSPPLNMSSIWFKNHVAYTMAKYGMSMCVLGMAEEFKEQGVAVNALWPRTAIWTAAMEMLGGQDGKSQCRKVDIMSDAAYVILTKDSRQFTGNFCIDDEILKSVGITDLDQYACVPGSELLPDFFLDGSSPEVKITQGKEALPASASGISSTFKQMDAMLSEDLVQDIKASYQFDLSGSEQGTWYLDLKSGKGSVGQTAIEKPDCIMSCDSQLFLDMFAGKASPTTSFMTGKLKIKGDMKAAMKLERLMGKMKKSKL